MKRDQLIWDRARRVCLVQTLGDMGYLPVKLTERDAWYLSPLRQETKASFHVMRKRNLWYDHGIGQGGDVIDLVRKIKQLSWRQAVDHLSVNVQLNLIPSSSPSNEEDHRLKVLYHRKIRHDALTEYLELRKIPLSTAQIYCREVKYQVNDSVYFSLGLKNHLGGWELRNKHFKASSSPKTYTYIQKKKNKLLLTEGMFDLLSMALLEQEQVSSSDCIVLNSVSFAKDVMPIVSQYQEVWICFDNDAAGERATKLIQSVYPSTRNMSVLYKGFKDANEMLISEPGQKLRT